MKKLHILLAVALIFILASCAKVYTSTDGVQRASQHQTLAILPPTVTIKARPKKQLTGDALIELQDAESINIQKEIISWMLRRKSQGKIRVDVMDATTINAKLNKANIDGSETPSEVARLLGVDAVMTSSFAMSKPMSEAAALVLGLLVGVWGATNDTAANLELHDAETQKMIWNYDHTISGSVGSSYQRLVNGLMRNASRKMPYSKSK